MNFIKENSRILTVIAMVLIAFFNLFEFKAKLPDIVDKTTLSDEIVTIDENATLEQAQKVLEELEDRKGKQLVASFASFDVYSHLKLGLDLVGGAQFEFQAQPTKQVQEMTKDVIKGLVKVFENRVNASGTTEAIVQQVGKDRILVEVPGANPEIVKRRLLATANLEFKELVDVNKDVWLETGITGANLKRAIASPETAAGNWAISFELQPDAARSFGELTSRLMGKPLGIFLDGNKISAPIVRSAITGGSGEISGNFTAEEAQDLAVQLNAGALPVPVTILQERSIGATLGQESINKSLKAGAWGFASIVIFMLLLYRLPGFLASIALAIYVLFSLALFQSTVTLTLAGIAGFILSIGMAVDANILIFERAKEEMRQGKSVFISIKDGFDRAYSSIFDSNMNTAIVCLVLIIFGTGVVKGFAVTLLIGVAMSLVSSLYITKTLLFTAVKAFDIKDTKLFG
jgi:preprotein translocase subunit SecD